MAKKWTKQEEEFLQKNWHSKQYKEIGKILNKTEKSVRKKAIRLGIYKKKQEVDYSVSEENIIRDFYCGEINKEELLIRLSSRDYNAIKAKASRMGIAKQSTRKNFFNESYFSQINERSAYFYGLWCADGYMRKNTISITLQQEDSYLLGFLQKEIGSDYSVRKRVTDTNIITELSIHSKNMCDDIKNLGGHTRKSKTITFPEIDELFYHSFIRGLFDGDGWFTIHHKDQNPRFGLVGSKVMLNKIRQIFCFLFSFDDDKNLYDKQNYSILEYGGKKCLTIMDYLYDFRESEKDLYMKRKYEKYIDFKSKKQLTGV